ncbi:uncharacterized protein CANTADRAFT_6923 [Suhomyces tanzawaensis NRRL Y-17324]|uniref:DUF2423 domain-containing protein n=1 Tax=Suhomyces tanzawaensis NRRL Y-17324 TaxID=984487 RepID=A0A1E4SGH7_9ASCO|nr:uncharacterized protein CANTADRAFT_6923 [Suhomyces tanzawaensis NRRL Y-17324]ODV78565.1 hypothetical protein CANTADRAFT_6923 [Suhomyces tanzawaensis NRRL Y-17324]
MAKSLRSKSKLRAKSVKRKGEFANFVDGRNKRLSEKMEQELLKQKEAALAKKKDQADAEGAEEPAVPEQDMDVDKTPKKISTSGWRDSRNQIYKKKHLKKKANKSTNY